MTLGSAYLGFNLSPTSCEVMDRSSRYEQHPHSIDKETGSQGLRNLFKPVLEITALHYGNTNVLFNYILEAHLLHKSSSFVHIITLSFFPLAKIQLKHFTFP